MKSHYDTHEARHLEKTFWRSIEPEFFIEYEFQLDYDFDEIRTCGQAAFIGTKREFQQALDFLARFKAQTHTEQSVTRA
jgi:hypothetical protein